MSISARIDELACAGHGDCVAIAPRAFALDDVAVVIGTAPKETLLAAARACPSAAISLIDDETGEHWFP